MKILLENKTLDFLFIDGDHTYQGVSKDFKMYSPLVKEKGIIAFHDILFHPQILECEVDKFWIEIKEKFDYKEFIENKNQGWGGIGIIYND